MGKLLILCVALILAGCVALPLPHDRQISPLFYGKVHDSKSLLPLSGVTVTVKSLWTDPNTGNPFTAVAETDIDGNYSVAASERATWFFLWFGPAEGTCGGTLTFSHHEYQTIYYKTQRFRGAAVDGVCQGEKHEYNALLIKKSD